jgi:predicted PurR-regulated permease PerM
MKTNPLTNRGWALLFWLALLAFLLLAIHLLSGILLPFVAAFFIAYFLAPLVDRLETWRLSRTLATLVVLLLFLLVLALVVMLILPLIEAQVSELSQLAPTAMDQGRQQIQQLLKLAQERLSPEDAARLRDMAGSLSSAALGWAVKLAEEILTSGVALANLLSLIFITPLVAFYLLRDWDSVVSHLESWVPRRHTATVRKQMAEINKTLSGFMHGQTLMGLILAIYYAVALSVAGTNFAIVIGILIGILSFIPVFGVAIGLVLAMGLTLVQTPTWTAAGIVAAIFAVGQVAENSFLSPKLIGGRVNLHPVWVIFALLAFGKVFGLLGVLLALPAAAVTGVMVRFGMSRYLASAFYDGGTRPRRRRG